MKNEGGNNDPQLKNENKQSWNYSKKQKIQGLTEAQKKREPERT